MQSLVSVVIPVYNRETTIMRALDSVLDQTYSNMEVIVVDDGSIDSTVEIVKKCKDTRVHLICLPSNMGANTARNRGIREAKGEYIAFQDSDDEWIKDKLEKQLRYMKCRGKKASYSPYYLHEENKLSIIPNDYKNRDLCEGQIANTLKTRNVVGTPTLIIKKEVFSRTGMFDEKIKCLQDYEFMLRLVREENLGYIEEPLVHAYRMECSITSNREAKMEAYVRILEKHFDFVDLEVILCDYLKNAEVVWGRNVNWKEFDRVTQVVRKSADSLMVEKCYKFAMQYFVEQRYARQRVLEEWYSFFKNYICTQKFAIYGAGFWGKKVYDDMRKGNCIPWCFLVTEQKENAEIYGVPVKNLKEYTDLEAPVIIAVSWEKQKELVRNLLDKGIHHFCVYPYC